MTTTISAYKLLQSRIQKLLSAKCLNKNFQIKMTSTINAYKLLQSRIREHLENPLIVHNPCFAVSKKNTNWA